MSQELQDAIQECREVLERNRRIFYFTDHCEYSYYDVYNKLNEFTFTFQSMDHIDDYIHRKIVIGENFTDSEAIGIVNRYTSHNLIPFKLLQIENPMNLQNAKDADTYEETDDVIYWWDADKTEYNSEIHDISFEDAIDFINYDEDINSIKDLDISDDDTLYDKIYLLKTIIDNKHKSFSKFKTVGGTMEYEKNIARYVLYFNNKLKPITVKVVYNVRYSQIDEKLVIKFATVYEDKNVPNDVRNIRTRILQILDMNLKELYEQNFYLFKKEDLHMKFEDRKTKQVIDLSNRNPDTITLDEIKHYHSIDPEARRLKLGLISEESQKQYDYDKIFPSYDELMYGGIWMAYYMEKELTDFEWKRREKYYEGNRKVFNEYLDLAREKDSSFIKNNSGRYTAAKEAICYGAPQRIVRNRMKLLFGEEVLLLLPLEDPEDAILDKNIDKWKMTYSD